MVVAVLAIFKAGGAYLPLDPTHPLQRLRSIREEAGARLVLTRKGIVSELAEGAERIDLDSESAQIARESSGNLAVRPPRATSQGCHCTPPAPRANPRGWRSSMAR